MALQEINDLRRAGPYRQFLAIIGQHEILYLARQFYRSPGACLPRWFAKNLENESVACIPISP